MLPVLSMAHGSWVPAFACWARSAGTTGRVSILIEHLLNLVRLAGFRQRELQQDSRLLRTEVVGGDEARLLPIIVAHDTAGADAGAAHHDDSGSVEQLLERLARILGVAGAGARDHQALGAGGDLAKAAVAAGAKNRKSTRLNSSHLV